MPTYRTSSASPRPVSAAAELLEHATVAWSRPEGFAALLHTHPPALMVKGGAYTSASEVVRAGLLSSRSARRSTRHAWRRFAGILPSPRSRWPEATPTRARRSSRTSGGGDALPVADLSEPYRLSDAARGDLVEIDAHSATVNVAAAAGVADDIEATCQLLGSIPASVVIVTSWALE